MLIEAVSGHNLMEAAAVHAEAWRESHRSICSEAFVAEHTTQRQMIYIRNEMLRGRRFFMLTDEKPVAVASVADSLIADLYVLPAYQRRGYGARMLEFAMDQCDEDPVLWVLNINQDAQRLYARHGFAKTGRIKALKNDLFEIEMICKKG